MKNSSFICDRNEVINTGRQSFDVTTNSGRKVGTIRVSNTGALAQCEVISGVRMPESIVSMYGQQAIDLAGYAPVDLDRVATMVRGFELDIEGDMRNKANQFAEEICDRSDSMEIPASMQKEAKELDDALVAACGKNDALPETTAAINDAARKYSRLLDRIQRNKAALEKARKVQEEFVKEATACIENLKTGDKQAKAKGKELSRNLTWWTKLFNEYVEEFNVSKVLTLQSKEETALLLAKGFEPYDCD